MYSWDAQSDTKGSLYVQQSGWQRCASGHQYGPTTRDHYLIHFVASGKGTFWTQAGTFPLSAGQGFLIFPGQITTYRADEKDPWTYAWVGYNGYDAEPLTREVGLTREAPIFSHADPQGLFSMLQGLSTDVSTLRLGALSALGSLYQLLAQIGQALPTSRPDLHQEYYHKALWYMESNYERPIRIEDVAAFVGLSRSQLFRAFQAAAGISPKAALTALRIGRAQRLLSSTSLSTEQIALSVGLSSAARLGVLFREGTGMTPTQYRGQHARQ